MRIAKSLVRVEACRRLHKFGLLNDELLPLDFRQIVDLCKHNGGFHPGLDEEYLTRIIEKMQISKNVNTVGKHETELNSTDVVVSVADKDFIEMHSVMSQAQVLMTPIDDFVIGDFADDPYIVECSEDTDLMKRDCTEILPHILEFNVPLPTSPPVATLSPTVSNGKVIQPSPCSLEVDDELPLEEQKKKPKAGCQTKSRFYSIHRIFCLSAPYQQPIMAGHPVYLYTWSLPLPEDVAKLTNINPSCFTNVDQTIGLVFSNPISQSNYVCRLPLYLQWGMARVRVLQRRRLTFSPNQLQLAQRTHKILSRLIVDINRSPNFGIQYKEGSISFLQSPTLPESSSPIYNQANQPILQGGSTSRAVCVDQFEQLCLSVEETQIAAMFLLVRLPDGRMDEEASLALVNWSAEQDYVLTGNPVPADVQKPMSVIQSGVVSRFGVQLSMVPPNEWSGLLVRPMTLQSTDPGGFAVIGPESSGLVCNSPISKQMLGQIPDPTLGSCEPVSFAQFFRAKYRDVFAKTKQARGIDLNFPVVSAMRLSRNLNAAIVSAGYRVHSKPMQMDNYLPQLCLVHPLNAWLWLILCLTPTVLYQMVRSLSACELACLLTSHLYDDENVPLSSDGFPTYGLPEGNFVMPDRASVPLNHIPSISKSEGCGTLANKPVFDMPYSLADEVILDQEVENQKVLRGKNKLLVPDPVELLKATTAMSANDAINLERLELLGDSVIKFAATLLVYSTSSSSSDEGQLSYSRIAYISNANLHRLSVETHLCHYLWTALFEPMKTFLPPGYAVADHKEARASHDPRVFVRIYDKTIADSIEALLGAFLLHCEVPAVVRFLNFLKLSARCDLPMSQTGTEEERLALHDAAFKIWAFSKSWNSLLLRPDKPLHADISSQHDNFEIENMVAASLPPAPKSSFAATYGVTSCQSNLNVTIESLECALEKKNVFLASLQTIIGYKFQRIQLLIQATTHSSSLSVYRWGCYQRLEFIGDAILDFIVTRRIFADHASKNPGQLTDLRTALVSNINLAIIAVRFGVHKFLDHADLALWKHILSFSEVVLNYPYKLWQLEDKYSGGEQSLSYKVLGDLVEAIIGAVYIDCGGSESIVTTVIFRLLDREFEIYGKELPIDPIRLMYEMYPKMTISATESVTPVHNCDANSYNRSEGRPVCRVKAIVSDKLIVGEGINLRAAKLSLARQLGVGFDY